MIAMVSVRQCWLSRCELSASAALQSLLAYLLGPDSWFWYRLFIGPVQNRTLVSCPALLFSRCEGVFINAISESPMFFWCPIYLQLWARSKNTQAQHSSRMLVAQSYDAHVQSCTCVSVCVCVLVVNVRMTFMKKKSKFCVEKVIQSVSIPGHESLRCHLLKPGPVCRSGRPDFGSWDQLIMYIICTYIYIIIQIESHVIYI